MDSFQPAFEVSWDDAPKSAPIQKAPPAHSIQTFGIDEAFAGYTPNFQTTVPPIEAVEPPVVPKVETLKGTIAAKIFSEYCKKELGFELKLKDPA